MTKNIKKPELIVDPIVVDPIVVDPIVVDPIVVDPIVVDPIVVDPIVVDPKLAVKKPKEKKSKIKFILSPTGKFGLAYGVDEIVEMNANQANEIVESGYAEFIK
jgi:hypothetical protein